MSAYGKAAFEAAMRKLNDGDLPAREKWEALLPLQQEAWESAAAAVLILDAEQHKSVGSRGAVDPERETFGAGDTV